MYISLRVLYALDLTEKHGCIIDEASLKLFSPNTMFHMVTIVPKVVDTTGYIIGVIDKLNEDRLNQVKKELLNLVQPLEVYYNFQVEAILDNAIVEAIKEYVDQHRIDCVILNGRKHGFWGRHVTGIQERLIGTLDCDVIISKKTYANRLKQTAYKALTESV